VKPYSKLLYLPFFLGLATAFAFVFAAGFAALAGLADFFTAGTFGGTFAGWVVFASAAGFAGAATFSADAVFADALPLVAGAD